MSRTTRVIFYSGYFRVIQTFQSRKLEQLASYMLTEEGFLAGNRLRSRCTVGIPSDRDDLKIAAMYEMDYWNGTLRNHWREFDPRFNHPDHIFVSRRFRDFRETIRRAPKAKREAESPV